MFAALEFALSAGWAQTSIEPDATAYRRVFVPADAPDNWPTGRERFLPLTSEKFLKLWNDARDPSANSARLGSTVYRGELVDDALLVGTASFDVELPDNKPRIALLEPLNLAVTSATWQGEDAPSAQWGLWNRSAQRNVWGVLAPRSGTLQVNWQLRAESQDAQHLEYVFDTPPAVPQTLELLLPVDYQAVLPSAQLVRTQAESATEQRWLFQLASRGPHHLKLLRQATTAPTPRLLLRVSQATAYRLEPEGLKVISSFRVEPPDGVSVELRCALVGGLQVKSVVLDRKPVEWRWDESSAEGTLMIRLSDSDKPRELEIEALAPLELDRPWRLPTIRSTNAEWTEGTSLVVVSPELELESLSTQSGTLQHIVGLQPEAASTEAYRVQEWSQDAGLEVIVARLKPRLSVEAAAAIALGANETTARIAARISSAYRATYQFSASIAAGWSIDSVKTDPLSALREWHVEDDGQQGVLHLQLNRPIRPGEPLGIEFDARAEHQGPTSANELRRAGSLLPSTVGELQILRFVTATTRRELLLLRSRPQRQMELLHGLEAARVTPAELSPSDRTLLPDPIVGELINLSELAAGRIVELRPRRARYEVEVSAELAVLPQSSAQLYEIECRPLSGEISEIAVRFDQPLPESAEWTLLSDSAGFAARRLAPTLDPSFGDDGATYLVKLPYAATYAARLTISYSEPIGDSTTYNAISFPQAVAWSGQVVLRGPLDGLLVEDAGWIPVGWPTIASEDAASPPVASCYRLESANAARLARTAPLVVHRTAAASDSAPLVAWLAEYRSHQAADGAAIYSAVYFLENSGAAELEIALPAQTELQASWLNGQQLEQRPLQAGERTYQFRLTDAGRYPTLALQYVARGPALGRSTSIQPALPLCSFPIRLSRWTLWTPEQFVPDDLITGHSARRVPWRERLFGPLARAVDQEAFLPWRAGDWPQLWSTPVEGLRTRLLAEHFASRLAKKLTERTEQTWSQLFDELAVVMEVEEVVLLDAVALRAAGIEPASRPEDAMTFGTAEVTTGDGVAQEARQLASHALALVFSRNRLVITTSERVAHWREQLQPTSAPRVYVINSEELALELETKSEQAGGEIVSVHRWSSAEAPLPTPWNDQFANSMSDAGQRACTIEFVDELPTVVVRRAYAQQANWYVAWLATVVGGVWWLGRRTDRLVVALAVAAAACFVAPPHWLTIPQAVFVGLLSAVVLHLVLRKTAVAPHEQSTRALLARSAPLALLACAALAVTEAGGAPVGQDLPRVLVPIDAAGNRQGEDVYLSESHLAALERARGSIDHDGARYALLETAVRGNLQSSAQDATTLTETWTISLKLESFVPSCEVELPWRESDCVWLAELCSLDGKPVALRWQPDGGVRVDVSGTGEHQLKLAVRPKLQTSAPRWRLELPLPRMPGVRLDLAVPPGVEDLNIAGAGSISRDAKGIWRTTLAPVESLRLAWTTPGKQPLSERIGNVEQLSWLHVEPAVARLAVQFHFDSANKTSRILELEVTPELKLLPPEMDSPVERFEMQFDEPGLVRLHLKPGWETNPRVPLEFQLQRTSSLGRFYFPSVRLRGFAPARRLFAADVGSGLSYHEEANDSLRSIPTTEFSTAWGEADRTPLFAYSLGEVAADWSLRVWPDPRMFVAEQSLALYCESDGLRVEYVALVNQVVGNWLIHQLQTPAELEIEEIALVEQLSGATVPMRWSRGQGSQVTILLGQPLGRPHLLRLKGRIHPAADGTAAVPRIVLAGAERGEVHLTLWRDPQVLTSWVDPAAAPRELSRPDVSSRSPQILVGRYTWRADQPSGERRLQVRANDRQFTANTVETIDENELGRTASLRAHINVTRGVVDQLQFSVPANLVEPYELQPAGVGVVSQVEDFADRRQVMILLAQPVEEGMSRELRFSGRLVAPADGRVEAPNLGVVGATGGRRYLMLPTRLADRPIEWQTAGLRREPLPESLSHFASESKSELPYRVVGPRFVAQEPAYQGPLRNAALRHAWVDGVLDAQGNFIATASLLLQPGRATHCSVRLPAGAQLWQIVADDQPACRQLLPDGGWRLALGPPFLPRLIKVTYLLDTESPTAKVRLAPPAVLIGDAPLPSPLVDWRISPVGGMRIAEPTLGRRIAGAKYAETRYRQLVAAVEDAAALALESPLPEVRSWFEVWRGHIATAVKEVSPWDSLAAKIDMQPVADAEPTSWSELQQKLGEAESAAAFSWATVYPPRLPRRPYAALGRGAAHLTSDSAGQIEITSVPLAVGNVWRWVAAAAILAVGLMLERNLQSRPGWIEALGRWPHALAFGAGALWWSLLSPSAVGLLMMVLAAVSLGVEFWRKRRGLQSTNTSTQLTARAS